MDNQTPEQILQDRLDQQRALVDTRMNDGYQYHYRPRQNHARQPAGVTNDLINLLCHGTDTYKLQTKEALNAP